MKRYILLLATVIMFAMAANAANDFRPRHPRYRHNHSLRYVRFVPRTCPACAFIARHHGMRPTPPPPPRHHAPAPRHHRPAAHPRRHHKAYRYRR